MERFHQDNVTETKVQQDPESEDQSADVVDATPETAQEYDPTGAVIAVGSKAVLGWRGSNTDHLIGGYGKR
jgi:hypothetical protein